MLCPICPHLSKVCDAGVKWPTGLCCTSSFLFTLVPVYCSFFFCPAIPNFLTSQECDAVVELSRNVGLEQSMTAALLELEDMKAGQWEDSPIGMNDTGVEQDGEPIDPEEYFSFADSNKDGLLSISEVRFTVQEILPWS